MRARANALFAIVRFIATIVLAALSASFILVLL